MNEINNNINAFGEEFTAAARAALIARAKLCAKDGKPSSEWKKTIESICGDLYCINGAEYFRAGAEIYCECFNISADEFISRMSNNDSSARRYCAQKALLKFSFILQALAGATDESLTYYSRRYHKHSLCDGYTHNWTLAALRLTQEKGETSALDLKTGLGYKWRLNRDVNSLNSKEIENAPECGASTTNTQAGQIHSILQAFTDSIIMKEDKKTGEYIVYDERRAIQSDSDILIIDPRFLAVLASIGGWSKHDSKRM